MSDLYKWTNMKQNYKIIRVISVVLWPENIFPNIGPQMTRSLTEDPTSRAGMWSGLIGKVPIVRILAAVAGCSSC